MERSQRWRKPLLIVHIVATVSLIGTTFVLIALGVSGLNGADPATIYPAAHLVEAWVVAPLSLLALGSGLLLGLSTQWGLVRHWWVTIKLAITAGFVPLVFLVLIPRLATTADAATNPAPDPFGTAERLPLAIAPGVALTLLVLNVILTIYKPGGRLRIRRRSGQQVTVPGADHTT